MMLFLAEANPTDHVVDEFILRIGGVPVLTTHTIMLVFVGAIFLIAMIWAARRIETGPESEGNERYITKGRFAQMVESITVYLRDEMLVPVMGEKVTKQYLPFLMTVFLK